MSLINEMLRDLDRRQALAVAEGQLPPGHVTAVARPPHGRQWFWTLVSFLMLLAIAWVGWVAYQIHARPLLATELAFRAAEERKARPPEPQPAPAAASVAQAPPATPEPAKESEPPELFKLAQLIETPIAEAAKPKASAPAPSALPPQQKARIASSSTEPAVIRRDVPRTPSQQAEAQFRQGVVYLNQGRVTEAQDQFSAAIASYAPHLAARQALVSILIDRGGLDEARRTLEEGLTVDPGNVQFATVLARIFVERRDYASAANALAVARNTGEKDPDYQVLLGVVSQHLGRHAEASAAFEKAAALKPQPPTTWLAMGISLEASGRKAEALDAYRRSLSGNVLSQEARGYAETRIRALR